MEHNDKGGDVRERFFPASIHKMYNRMQANSQSVLSKAQTSPHLDRHSCAVKAKWPETRFALEPLVSHGELAFGESEGVTKMQLPIHVRIREAREELLI